MKIKLVKSLGGKAFLKIPDNVLKELGWEHEDVVVVDIPTTHPDQLIIYKERKHG